ncbi:MAG: VCBS repeat-containing protein, partial [Myxococcales bacterium]|nr:VCBS repeat-containing protein [Myxococcales bacterium]
TRPEGGGRLYHNRGEMRFEDVTVAAGLPEDGWTTGPAFVDYDGDGDLDLFVGRYAEPCRLFRNDGGKFTDVAPEVGLALSRATVAAAFADFDRDGDLDVYLVTNRQSPAEPISGQPILRDGQLEIPDVHKEYLTVLMRDGKPVIANAGQADHLLRNDGGKFTDVSAATGIDGFEMGLSARFWDYDDDGWPDLYVSNDFFGADRLYHNERGRFVLVTGDALPHTPWFSMGVDAADVDGDGRLDFFATDMSGTTHFKQKLSMGDMSDDGWFLDAPWPRQYMRNALYINTGTRRFAEAAYIAGMANTDWTWSPRFGDLDEDGRIDLFVTNGMTRDFSDSDIRRRLKAEGKWQSGDLSVWEAAPPRNEANLAFRNRGDLRFEPAGGPWGLDAVGISFGAALGDLDGDGDLDVVVNDFEAPARVYRNRSAGSHRLHVRLEGPAGNRFGIGALVSVTTADGRQVRDLPVTSGFMSANEPVIHFGLGGQAMIDSIEVRWPDGLRQAVEGGPADQLLVIRHPAKAAERQEPAAPQPDFVATQAFADYAHRERPFDDFAKQPLLPFRHSARGPGFAWGDIDGDGDDDLYIGGAAGSAGTLLRREGDRMEPVMGGPFAFDAESEDLGAVFLDVENDGDLDLYVVSGSVEVEPGDERLRDRLYLNRGDGNFDKSDGRVPHVHDSGAVVAAGDFDGDGDLDLFVGGRVVPGAYPLTPNSRLLRNEDGALVDVTDAVAPGLGTVGLVTGAVWLDADADGRLDLAIATEWGPVHLWRGGDKGLTDATAAAGLGDRLGWWGSLAMADIDEDGDPDLIAGNVGLNTRYHASADHPTLLYYGKFDDGPPRIVEADYEDTTLYPVRGRSCSSAAMPELADRFPTFSDFARAELTTIYSPEKLAAAQRFVANTFESGVWLNDGVGKFEWRPVPRAAQLAPVRAIVANDFDADGHLDLYLAQNDYSPQRETGRFDGGIGAMLRGLGDGTFALVDAAQTGVAVGGEAAAAGLVFLNDDGLADLVVAINDGPLLGWVRRPDSAGKAVRVRLKGPAGNPTGTGAAVIATLDDGSTRTAWIGAGSGGLGASAPEVSFGLGAQSITGIEVRWPDGKTSQHPAPSISHVVLAHP